jgi:hypothetical protein
MARIYLDINDIASRSEDIAHWLRRGDQVFVTRCGPTVFRIAPSGDTPTTPPQTTTTTSGPTTGGGELPPRVLGLHQGTTTPGPDFNDPLPEAIWSGEVK